MQCDEIVGLSHMNAQHSVYRLEQGRSWFEIYLFAAQIAALGGHVFSSQQICESSWQSCKLTGANEVCSNARLV